MGGWSTGESSREAERSFHFTLNQYSEKPGELSALLRKKGLYSSHISNWRKQLNSDGNIAAVKRGRRPDDSETKATKALAEENRSLRKEEAKLERRLKRAELMLDIQKKASELLGIPLRSLEDDENDS